MWLGAAECVAHWAAYDRSRTALIVDGVEISYGALGHGAFLTAKTVEQASLRGKRIAVVCADKTSFLCSAIGAQLAGASIILPHPTWTADMLVDTLSKTNPSAFIADSQWIGPLRQRIPSAMPIQAIAAIEPASRATMLDALDSVAPRAPSDEWGLIFSSGSTGNPKPIVQTNYSMMTECLAWCLELGIRRGEKFYVARPLYYTGGLVLALATLMCRGQIILDHYLDQNDGNELIAKLIKACSARTIDWCFVVPEVARGLLLSETPWPCAGNPQSFLVMGSKIYGHEKRSLAERFGCSVVESWGNSEGLGTITDPEDLVTKPDSIGRPFLTERLAIVDDQLHKVAPNQVGRLVGSDETMFKEYASLPEATKRAKRDDLVLSDDIGSRDEDGYFYILGREEDVVVFPTVTVSMSTVENTVRQSLQGSIKDVYVCASKRANDTTISILAAVADAASDKSHLVTALTGIVRAAIADESAVPTVKFTNAIPKLSSGKIDRIRARGIIQGN